MVTTCASVLGMACPDLGSGGSVSTIPSRPRARKQAWPSQVRSMEWAENTRNTAPAEGVSRLTDQEIVKLCLGGDADAYATLVERYGGRAYNIALRITNDRDAANDCAQEAFIRAYRALHQCHGGATRTVSRRAHTSSYAAALLPGGRRRSRDPARHGEDASPPGTCRAEGASCGAPTGETRMSRQLPDDLDTMEMPMHRLLSAVPPQPLPLGFR